MERYSIAVVPEDINTAVRGKVQECPLARALQRTYPEATNLWVGYSKAFFTLDGEERVFRVDTTTMSRIISYDSTGWMVPFEASFTED